MGEVSLTRSFYIVEDELERDVVVVVVLALFESDERIHRAILSGRGIESDRSSTKNIAKPLRLLYSRSFQLVLSKVASLKSRWFNGNSEVIICSNSGSRDLI